MRVEASGMIMLSWRLCSFQWYPLVGRTDDGYVSKNQFLDSLMSNWR